MPLTGILLLPSTNLSSLTTHISTTRPELDHHPFHLEHRLFNDTSSQLPNTTERSYTHLLSTSHDKSAFIASSTSTSPPSLELITIPRSDFDGFGQLIVQKMQPLWFTRTVTHVDGIQVKFQIGGKQLELCVGEIKVKGSSRGCLIEVYHGQDVHGNETENQALFRAILGTVFGEVLDVSQVTVVSGQTRGRDDSETNWELARLYMEVFTPGRAPG